MSMLMRGRFGVGRLKGCAATATAHGIWIVDPKPGAGKIVRIQGFLEWREALEDAGVRE